MDDWGSFGDSWEDFHGDSCGFSECVPAFSSDVPVVTDVSVSYPSLDMLGEAFPFLTLIVRLSSRSPFLSPESVQPSIWKVTEI